MLLNDEDIGPATDTRLEGLGGVLEKLRENAALHGGAVLATLQTEPDASYQRVIEVMNALSRAKITNVTFTVGEESDLSPTN